MKILYQMDDQKNYNYEADIVQLDQVNKGKRPLRRQFAEVEECQSERHNSNQHYIHKNSEGQYIDTRKEGTYKYPNSAIGIIKLEQKTEGKIEHLLIGTGFLIREDIVLTCAHNCYDRQMNKELNGLRFYIGGQKQKRECYKVKEMYYLEKFKIVGKESSSGTNKQQFLYDYAILRLSEKTGYQYGTLGVKFVTEIADIEYNKKVKISGYPLKIVDRDKHKPIAQDRQDSEITQKESLIKEIPNKNEGIYEEEGDIIGINEELRVMEYKITTTKGQSGSPIIHKENGQHYAIGVHIYGQTGIKNTGIVLDNEKRCNINIWIGKSTGILNLTMNHAWAEILRDQDFKIITSLKLSHVQAGDFEKISSQQISNKLKDLKTLSIRDLPFNGLNGVIQFCNTLSNIQQCRIIFNLSQFEFGEVQNQEEQEQTQNTLQAKYSLKLTFIAIPKEFASHILKKLTKILIISSLTLSQSRLSSIPPEIEKLKNLQLLNLSNNQIQQLPKEIGNLKKLKKLKLSKNLIKSFPNQLEKLKNLQQISLQSSGITEFPKEICSITNLSTLKIKHNNISQIPREIGNLSSLKLLDLSANILKKLPGEIGNLTNLKQIRLQFNQIENLPIQIYKLINLHFFSLFRNQLTEICKDIGALTNLQELYLHKNSLKEVPPQIGNLVNLKVLRLQANHIKSLPQQMENLRNLISLNISENELEICHKFLINLMLKHNLRDLDLSKNKILKLPIQLAQWEALYQIHEKHQKIVIDLTGNEELDKFNRFDSQFLDKILSKRFWKTQKNQKKIEDRKKQNLEKLKKANKIIKSQWLYNQYTQLCEHNFYEDKVKQKVLRLGENQVWCISGKIGRLTQLQRIEIYDCSITQLPAEIGNLINLKLLKLLRCQLRQLPKEVGNLKNLQELIIDKSKIRELPKQIGDLTNLKDLQIAQSQLIGLPEEVGNLKKLQTMWLSENKISKLPTRIGDMQNIRRLNICDNQLTGIPSQIGKLLNLRVLNIKNNKIKELPLEIGNLTNLQNLFASNNEIGWLPKQFGKLRNLSQLEVNNNQISKIEPWIVDLIVLYSLTDFQMADNKIVSLPTNFRHCLKKFNKKQYFRINLNGNKHLSEDSTLQHENILQKHLLLKNWRKRGMRGFEEQQAKIKSINDEIIKDANCFISAQWLRERHGQRSLRNEVEDEEVQQMEEMYNRRYVYYPLDDDQ